MKMRKKKRLFQNRARLPYAQPYAAWVMPAEELAKAMDRVTRYIEANREVWKQQMEAAAKWAAENPDAFKGKGVLCGKTK